MSIEMQSLKTAGICIAGTLLLAGTATASEDAIEKCRTAATADEQIACLEAALRGDAATAPASAGAGSEAAATEPVAPAQGPAASAGPDPAPASASASASATYVDAETGATEMAATPRSTQPASAPEKVEPEPPAAAAAATSVSSNPDPAPAPAEPVSAAAVAATSSNAEPPSTPEAAPDGIGAEQVVARNMTREEQLASLESASGLKVARYGEVPYQRLVVHLENGQVWRQIQGDDQYFRVDLKRNQTVDINETSMGGYKLRLNEMRRTIRVERVE